MNFFFKEEWERNPKCSNTGVCSNAAHNLCSSLDLCGLFLHIPPNRCPLLCHFTLKDYLIILCPAGLLAVYSLSFCFSWNEFIYLLISPTYKIRGWKKFSFVHCLFFNISFQCHLSSMVSVEKLAQILLRITCTVKSCIYCFQ